MNQPPPLQPPPAGKSLFHQAAKACLAAPLIAIIINFLGHASMRTGQASAPSNPGTVMIVEMLALLLFVLGVVFAVIALFGIGHHGKQGLLGRGCAGLLINGLLVALFITNFVSARNRALSNRQAIAQLASATEELREEAIRSMEADAVTNDPGAQLEILRNQINDAGQIASGENKKVVEAMSAFVARLQPVIQRFTKIANQVWESEPANFGTLTDKEQIATRRELIQRFSAANQEFSQMCSNQADILREELELRQLPRAEIEKLISTYRQQTSPTRATVLAMRECDNQNSKVLLSLLDLAESQWGKWHYDQENDYTVFEDEKSANEFAQLAERLNASLKRQDQLSRELLELQKQAATRAGSTR